MDGVIILFDIDGTLLQTGGAGRRSFEAVFEELFGVTDSWGMTNAHGKSDPMIFADIAQAQLSRELTAEEVQKLIEGYTRNFKAEIARSTHFRLLPSVPELLRSLAIKNHVHLGLETGNFETTARLKLARGNINHFFSFGGYSSDHELRDEFVRIGLARGKEEAERKGSTVVAERIFLVGDAVQDMRAAKANGITSIGVCTGGASEEQLRENGAAHVLKDLSDLEAFHKIVGL